LQPEKIVCQKEEAKRMRDNLPFVLSGLIYVTYTIKEVSNDENFIKRKSKDKNVAM
jgi:hypothetical protein